MANGIIAIDADGVLLDYNLAYRGAWQKAFGNYPVEKDPYAYWAIERWDVELLEGEKLAHLRKSFEEDFWSSIPPMAGALEGCRLLVKAGYELVCVSSLAEKYSAARMKNLQAHDFPIEIVYVVDHSETGRSPKADVLNAIKPVAFVDDYLPYFFGVNLSIHRALVMRGANGSPNHGPDLRFASSQHENLLAFSNCWIASKGNR